MSTPKEFAVLDNRIVDELTDPLECALYAFVCATQHIKPSPQDIASHFNLPYEVVKTVLTNLWDKGVINVQFPEVSQ